MTQEQEFRKVKKGGSKVEQNKRSEKDGPNKKGMNENINRVAMV